MRLIHFLLILLILIKSHLNSNIDKIDNKEKFRDIFSKYAKAQSNSLLNSYIHSKKDELLIKYYLDDDIYTYSDFFKWKIIDSLLNSLNKKEITIEDFNNVIKNKSSIVSPPSINVK